MHECARCQVCDSTDTVCIICVGMQVRAGIIYSYSHSNERNVDLDTCIYVHVYCTYMIHRESLMFGAHVQDSY